MAGGEDRQAAAKLEGGSQSSEALQGASQGISDPSDGGTRPPTGRCEQQKRGR